MRNLSKFTAVGIGILFSIALFQNCSGQKFAITEDSIYHQKYEAFSLLDQLVQVEMNKPKRFEVSWSGERGALRVSMASEKLVATQRTSNGQVQIVEGAAFDLIYTPDPFFRGEDSVLVYAIDSTGGSSKTPSRITFQVGNRLNFVKPALAVRGAACMACHANVSSNFVTDLGHGSYFLETGRGTVTNPNYGFYTDHGYSRTAVGSFATMKLSEDSETFVPRADLVGYLKAQSGETTLAGFFRNRFLASSHSSTRVAANKVKEVDSLFIGAPTAARLREVFGVASAAGTHHYLADDQKAKVPVGQFTSISGGVRITGDFTCDGDLLVQGIVHLDKARIFSQKGCRIYATGSIFVSNGIESVGYNDSPLHNVQLVSSRSVSLGLGSTLVASGADVCETTGWYRNRWATPANRDKYAKSSLSAHFELHQETSYTRAFGSGENAVKFLASIMQEAVPLGLIDATCESGGRSKAISRLLIVAPRVDSRYNGNFSGSIVAESSILSVGSFKFSFDPIFERVAILPLLNDSDFFNLEGQ